MLDAHIIDAIHQEELERERQRDLQRPRVWAPPPPDWVWRRDVPHDSQPEMGDPIVIPLVPPAPEEDAA